MKEGMERWIKMLQCVCLESSIVFPYLIHCLNQRQKVSFSPGRSEGSVCPPAPGSTLGDKGKLGRALRGDTENCFNEQQALSFPSRCKTLLPFLYSPHAQHNTQSLRMPLLIKLDGREVQGDESIPRSSLRRSLMQWLSLGLHQEHSQLWWWSGTRHQACNAWENLQDALHQFWMNTFLLSKKHAGADPVTSQESFLQLQAKHR